MPKWVMFRQNDSLIKGNSFSRKNRQNEYSAHRVRKNQKITLIQKIFRQINSLVTYLGI